MVSVIQNRQFFRIEMIPMNQVVTMDRSTLILIKLQSQRNSGAMSSLTAYNKWIKRTLDWIEKDDCDNIVSLDMSDTFRIEWLIIYDNYIVFTLSNIGDIWFTFMYSTKYDMYNTTIDSVNGKSIFCTTIDSGNGKSIFFAFRN